jgi:hypothetical protein
VDSLFGSFQIATGCPNPTGQHQTGIFFFCRFVPAVLNDQGSLLPYFPNEAYNLNKSGNRHKKKKGQPALVFNLYMLYIPLVWVATLQ